MKPKYTIRHFRRDFPNDDACLDRILSIRYGDNPECPSCERQTRFHRIASRRAYVCQWCGHHLYPYAGTPLENSKTPLVSWFYAMYLMVVTRNGVSAKELERQLGVTYKCAWRIGHKIRELMDLLGMRSQLSGHVEVDESYIGGKRKGGKRGRGAEGKTIVFGTLERGGDAKGRVVSDVKRKTLEPIVRATVKEGSTGLAQKLQATTRGDGLFRIELPPLAPDPEFLCKVPAGMFHRLIGNFAAPSPLGDARSPL